MKTIILATGNQNKAGEIREILSDLDVRVVTMREAGLDPEIVEDGDSFEANALIKVRAVRRALAERAACGSAAPGGEDFGADCLVLADDSGLEVAALGGAPGIYSARFMGETTGYTVKMAEIIRRLKGKRGAERAADFRCAMALSLPDGSETVTIGRVDGVIALEPAGRGGFGYDPILYVPELGMTTAQMTPAQKNAISHRGKALRMTEIFLRNYLREDR